MIIFQGGKTGGSPHVGRKFEGPHIGQNHMPTAALLHEAKLGEASLLIPTYLSLDTLKLTKTNITIVSRDASGWF